MKTRTIKNSQSAFALPSVVSIAAFLTIAGCDSANGVSASDAVTNTAQVETTVQKIIVVGATYLKKLNTVCTPDTVAC